VIIISDTSPVSNLLLVGRLSLLESLFKEMIVPAAVDKEIRRLSAFETDISAYLDADWITVVPPASLEKVTALRHNLDEGEAEAIVLAEEFKCDLLLMDERKGSKIARARGINTIGLLGVLLKAKELGLIKNAKPVLHDLKYIAGFWIGEELEKEFLKDVNE
jgi:uncharacterized protein